MDREEKARRAGELLDDPVLTEALDAIQKMHFERWASTNPDDAISREQCWYRYKAVEELRDEMRSVARGLEVEAHNRRINSKRQ